MAASELRHRSHEPRGRKLSLIAACAALFASALDTAAEAPGAGVRLRREKVLVDDGTVVHLPFDRCQDGRCANARNAKFPAEARGEVESVAGLFGQAVRTGPNGCLVMPGEALGVVNYVLTVEFWVRAGPQPFPAVVLLQAGPDDRLRWRLRMLSSEQDARLEWTVAHQDRPATVLTSSQGLDEPGRWTLISLVYGPWLGGGGSKAFRIYVDGYLVAEQASFNDIRPGAGEFVIRTPLGGAVDDLAVSARGGEIFPAIADSHLPLHNLDFERQAEGWIGVHRDCRIDGRVKHGGKHSLRIETDDLYTLEHLSPMFSVEPGAAYRISFWAKVDRFDQGYASIGVWVRWYFEPEETCSFGGDLVAHCVRDRHEATFDWRRFSAEIPVPRSKDYRKEIRWARLQVKNYHSVTRAWVDDIAVEKIAGPKEDEK